VAHTETEVRSLRSSKPSGAVSPPSLSFVSGLPADGLLRFPWNLYTKKVLPLLKVLQIRLRR
jgi:hypothetical protein